MEEVIKSIKENPREFVETVVLMSTLSVLFYVSIWIFH